jgi:hypothetical protein
LLFYSNWRAKSESAVLKGILTCSVQDGGNSLNKIIAGDKNISKRGDKRNRKEVLSGDHAGVIRGMRKRRSPAVS